MTNGALVGASFTGQTGTGTFRTSNATNPPFPAGQTWAGTIELNRSGVQFIPAGTYTNINATGGARTLNTGSISISGTFTPGSGTYTVSSSNTMNFNASGVQNVPALPSADYRNLTITNSGRKSLSGNVTVTGVLTVANAGGILAINGNTLNLQGTVSIIGSLAGSSTSNLTISGITGGATGNLIFNTASATDTLLNTFTLNRTGASSATSLGSNIAITNLLQITNGTFDLNGKIVTLKSTSISNTAQIGTIGGTITYNNGAFTVERFIPTPLRAYRDIAPGVNTYTGTNFFQTWQENGNSPAGFGTHITGLSGVSPGGVDATTGLDFTQTGAASLYSNTVGNWASILNTKTTKPNVYAGYRVLIRGDRNVNLYQSPTPTTMNVATTLRSSGQLIAGTVTYTTSGITGGLSSSYALNPTTNGYSFLANPYVAALDWSLLGRTNISSSYTVFDPTIGTSGAYVTCNTSGVNSNPSSNVNQYIQPGQAFFVETSASSPQLVISEANKATSSTLTGVFKSNTTVNKMSFTLIKSVSGLGNITMDGCVAVFDASELNSLNDADAAKVANGSDNISIFRLSKNLSIESRDLPTINDTIPLKIWSLANNATYTLSINSKDLSTSKQAFIVDNFTNTEKLVKPTDTTNITFVANTSNTATFTDRFYIVFRNSNALPISKLTLQASFKNGAVNVNWQTIEEIQLYGYEVESSSDAIQFKKIISVTARNESVNNYTAIDPTAQTGIWYYRLKIINQDGSFKYSNVAVINLNIKSGDLMTYPNPVRGNSLSVQVNNVPKGNYSVKLYNLVGQQLLHENVKIGNANSSTTILLEWKPQEVPDGNYSVVLTNENGYKITKQIVVTK
jgi:hypothetical protein